tara:strand:+ start:22 stop:543 length:522 start_codon:yes stop_codon:yes gene_type:complete
MKVEEANPNFLNLKPNYIYIHNENKKTTINLCIRTTTSITIKFKDNTKYFYSDKVFPTWIFEDKLCISNKFILTNTIKFNLEVYDINNKKVFNYDSSDNSNLFQSNINIINSKKPLKIRSNLSTREEKNDNPKFYELLTMKVRYTFISIKLLIAIIFNTLKKIFIYIFTNTVK